MRDSSKIVETKKSRVINLDEKIPVCKMLYTIETGCDAIPESIDLGEKRVKLNFHCKLSKFAAMCQ